MTIERGAWLTYDQREAAKGALARAYLPVGVAPDGYADVRARLWVQLAAARTVPPADEFSSGIGQLWDALTKAMNNEPPAETLAALDGALLAVGQAWQASELSGGWGE